MRDLHFKFEEDRTKTAVPIEDEWTIGISDRQTDGQTDIHSSDFISVECHGTDNELSVKIGLSQTDILIN